MGGGQENCLKKETGPETSGLNIDQSYPRPETIMRSLSRTQQIQSGARKKGSPSHLVEPGKRTKKASSWWEPRRQEEGPKALWTQKTKIGEKRKKRHAHGLLEF